MTKLNYTKGPWTKNNYGELVSPDGKQVVVWTVGVAWGQRSPEAESNDKLIAAAPDLYEAAVGLVNCLNSMQVSYQDRNLIDAVTALARAIAKAEGNTQ